MGGILAFFTFRGIVMLASTAFSLIFVMLILGIITADEVVAILNLSPEAANAFKLIVSRIMEITSGIIDIISQLLGHLLGWAGVEVDMNQISVDVNSDPGNATPAAVPQSVE